MRTVRRSHACHCIESPHPCMPSAASKGDASCRVQLSHGNHLSIMLAAAARRRGECGTTSRTHQHFASRCRWHLPDGALKASGTSRRLHRSRPASPRQESCWRDSRSWRARAWNPLEHKQLGSFPSRSFPFLSHAKEKRDLARGATKRGLAFASGQGGPLYC